MEFHLVPQNTALLIIDMQTRFVHGTPNGLLILNRINHLASMCRAAGILIVHTKHIFRQEKMNVLGANELHKDLLVETSDIIIEKYRLDAFHETELESILRLHEIDTVAICGLRTNECCMMSAYQAAIHDFRVLFLSDGTAAKERLYGISAAEHHRAACATIGSLFGTVLTINELIDQI
ncbi:MAG: isochorismatase family cysteine hydrolase [Chloroflexota bacterium]